MRNPPLNFPKVLVSLFLIGFLFLISGNVLAQWPSILTQPTTTSTTNTYTAPTTTAAPTACDKIDPNNGGDCSSATCSDTNDKCIEVKVGIDQKKKACLCSCQNCATCTTGQCKDGYQCKSKGLNSCKCCKSKPKPSGTSLSTTTGECYIDDDGEPCGSCIEETTTTTTDPTTVVEPIAEPTADFTVEPNDLIP